MWWDVKAAFLKSRPGQSHSLVLVFDAVTWKTGYGKEKERREKEERGEESRGEEKESLKVIRIGKKE